MATAVMSTDPDDPPVKGNGAAVLVDPAAPAGGRPQTADSAPLRAEERPWRAGDNGFAAPRRRGRPAGNGKPTPAVERMRQYRARKKQRSKRKPKAAAPAASPPAPPTPIAKRQPRAAIERRYQLVLASLPGQLARAAIIAMGPEIPAADDSVLALWALPSKLAEVLDVMAAWNFQYRSCACWLKDLAGPGHLVRDQHELLVLGTRGKPMLPAAGLGAVFGGRVRQPGLKPDEAYDLLDRLFPAATRIELFARQQWAGWDSGWGMFDVSSGGSRMAHSDREEAEEARRQARRAQDEDAAAERVRAMREAMAQSGLLPRTARAGVRPTPASGRGAPLAGRGGGDG